MGPKNCRAILEKKEEIIEKKDGMS